ncbi:hypothetical protein PUN28_014808 [Cardiocondyla obscurior]|uniref:Uncharacterized protein n=1 Tax=Cardiocondyla obscurior TaxID=286306 RepID=A0AAW2F1K7_9HYME
MYLFRSGNSREPTRVRTRVQSGSHAAAYFHRRACRRISRPIVHRYPTRNLPSDNDARARRAFPKSAVATNKRESYICKTNFADTSRYLRRAVIKILQQMHPFLGGTISRKYRVRFFFFLFFLSLFIFIFSPLFLCFTTV